MYLGTNILQKLEDLGAQTSLWVGSFLGRGRFDGQRSSRGSEGLPLKPAVTAVTGAPHKTWGTSGVRTPGVWPGGGQREGPATPTVSGGWSPAEQPPFAGAGRGWGGSRRSRGGKGTGAAAREARGSAPAARTGAPQDGTWARARRLRLCRRPGAGPG